MSNYTKATNFASKDALLTGNPSKIVKGTEIDNEFNAISTAVNSKFDTTALASPGPIGATTPAAITGTNIQATSYNGGQLAGLRNRIINGGMQIQQRGTLTVTASGQYSVDRWIVAIGSGTSISATSSSGGLVGVPSRFGCYIAGTWTTGQPFWQQRIESRNCKDLVNTQITVSGYINFPSGTNDTLNIRLRAATAVDNFGGLTNVKENTTSTITGGSSVFFSTTFSASEMNVADIANGLVVDVYKTNVVTHASTVNYVLSSVQLEVGPVATPFEQRPYGMELALCQRYFQAKTNTSSGACAIGLAFAATDAVFTVQFPVSMRTLPALSSVNLTVTNGSAVNIAGTGSSIAQFTGDSVQVVVTVASGLTIGQASLLRAGSGSGGSLFLNSEL